MATRLSVVVALVALVAQTVSAQDAAAVLRNAAAAMGAASVKSIRVAGTGSNAPR